MLLQGQAHNIATMDVYDTGLIRYPILISEGQPAVDGMNDWHGPALCWAHHVVL